MSIGERIIKFFGGATAADVQRAYEAGSMDANDEPPSGTLKSYGYKRVTTGNLRDFSKVDHKTALETAWTLWQSSPVAKRLLRIKTGYILGGGVQPACTDETLGELIERFWEDNKMNRRQREFCLQLHLFGEQCYPAFVRRSDGRVLLSYIDPGSIEAVIANPVNPMEMVAVMIGASPSVNEWMPATEKQVYRVIRKDSEVIDGGRVRQPRYSDMLVTAEQANRAPWEAEMLRAHGVSDYAGSVFFFKTNSISNQPRGYSDLLQLADWIDQADETLFALADREQMAGYFSWDVVLNGADDKAVKTRAKAIRDNPPRKGSVNVHNEAEAWTMNAPSLGQAGTIETYNALLTLVLGGAGYPRHWFGYGDETNRATAQAQGDPTWRTLEEDQAAVHDILLHLCEFARDQAAIAGAWRGSDGEIKISMPEMVSKDYSQVLSVLVQYSTALIAAVDSGWITKGTAAEAWARAMGEIGIDYDPVEELEEAQEEEENQELEELRARNEELETKLQQPPNQPQQPGQQQPGQQQPEESENA